MPLRTLLGGEGNWCFLSTYCAPDSATEVPGGKFRMGSLSWSPLLGEGGYHLLNAYYVPSSLKRVIWMV